MNKEELHDKQARSVLNVGAAFLMGYIDAYTFLELDHVFVSAQTGNMVTYGIKLITKENFAGLPNIMSLVGFMAGVFAGEFLLFHLKRSGQRRYRLFLSIQTVLLLGLASLQSQITVTATVFILGILAGFTLTTFRQLADKPVNIGIMTGNIRMLVQFSFETIFHKNTDARKQLLQLLLILFTFIAGVCTSAAIIEWHPAAVLWIAFVLISLTIAATYVK